MGKLEIEKSGHGIGADIQGLDLTKPLASDALAAINEAWAEHLVLRFHGTKLSDDQLMSFSQNFGPLDMRPVGKADQNSVPGNHYVTVISNVVENGRPIGGLGNLEAQWHVDMSYNPAPAVASILHAWAIPDRGGLTHFCNMYAALEGLPSRLRARIEGLSLKHDSAHTSVGGLRRGFEEAANAGEAPGAVHPLIRTHPVTQRQCLYLGRRQDAYIVGMALEDSEALLDEIWAAAVRPEYCWEHIWQLHDTVMWDNRCTLHRRDGFPNEQQRIMRRTQIGGDKVG
ncbi:MAG: TauD/TfdA family dioxygenase [Rhodospirillaceae bacterium]|jgi:taurine dioxygenase|nr:TauD/TfdA family dioxygenase [Rhodospirillaceae bacterium]MBT4490157.1 TauD/TfdA family dioxygenase [Rhodospirillaceae bacterium]MBT5894345.1 TauD/TfdA family dioxygenase [Rhodospirillaceae bacterium]MBT6428976.1 TauD/TfdA family dioxygenase [Rhodospirillaceae bacterium]